MCVYCDFLPREYHVERSNEASEGISLAIDPLKIISSTFGDLTKSYLDGSQTLKYYIFDSNVDAYIDNAKEGTRYDLTALEHSNAAELFIENKFDYIDQYIDLDFERVYTMSDADMRILSVSYYEP